MALILLLIICAISCAFLFLRRKMNYWKDRGIPSLPPSYIFGNMDGVGQKINITKYFQYVYETFKNESKVCGIYCLQKPQLIVTDLELIKNILTKDFNNFADRGVFHSENDPLSNHLFSMEGEKWRRLRFKLTETFTSAKMRAMYPIIQDFSHSLTDLIESLSTRVSGIDIKNVTMRFTADVVGSCSFGINSNALENENAEIITISQFFNIEDPKQRLNIFFVNTFQNFAKIMRMKMTPDFITNFFVSMIKETYDFREKNDVNRNDFMSLLMQIKKYGKLNDVEMENVGTLTFDELAAQAFIFYIGGFDTSSTTMSMALYELAYRKDIQDKLRNEIMDVIERHDGKISYEALKQMPYLDQVVDETLRLYSPISQLMRIAADDYKVPGMNFTIEKGTNIIIPTFAVHRDSRYYYDPENFNPDRFNPEEVKKRPALSFLAFGSGQRNCIGERFGRMLTKMGIATVLKNFKISLHENTRYPLIIDFNSLVINSFKPIMITADKI